MAAIYFIIFITSEAFICANLLVAMVTSSLWESPFTHAKEEQREQEPNREESQGQAPRAGWHCRPPKWGKGGQGSIRQTHPERFGGSL